MNPKLDIGLTQIKFYHILFRVVFLISDACKIELHKPLSWSLLLNLFSRWIPLAQKWRYLGAPSVRIRYSTIYRIQCYVSLAYTSGCRIGGSFMSGCSVQRVSARND